VDADCRGGAITLIRIMRTARVLLTGCSQAGQVAGFGNFSNNPGETDMIMRNVNTGAFEIYDIANNQLTSAFSMGAVGLDWQVAGFGPMNGAGTSDMVLRKRQHRRLRGLRHHQ